MAGAEWDALTIDVREGRGELVVAPRGELDIGNADRLRTAIGRRAEDQALRIDLRGLDFLDTSGLQALVDVYRDAAEAGFGLSIVRGATHITRVFEVAGLDDRLPFVDAAEVERAAADERHELRLDPSPYAAAQARDAVVGWLADVLGPERTQEAKLLVSELVTNSVRHAPAGGTLALVVTLATGGTVRVEVSDTGGRFVAPDPVEPPLDQVGGRGLLIVDRVATRWGTSHNGRNTVWFEL